MAFIKPRPDAPDPLTVAREKIAADLGYDLGLPVAPVVVKNPCDQWQRPSAVSLVCLGAGRAWGTGTDALRAQAAPALEALRVFWTWIGDDDHKGHHENLLYAVENGVVKLSAIDHARSLGHGMRGDLLEIPASIGYGAARLPGADEARRALVERIAALPTEGIAAIVRRLGSILTVAEQEMILEVLQVRSEALTRLLSKG